MFDRITTDSEQAGGQPCIRGLGVTVATIVGMVLDQKTEQQILAEYPELESFDIHQALRFATFVVG